ncbi:hypothetical protein HYR54_11950 [Candidatus Acetothermia bacterium]|nr:hypothetical protein [Candidatus Acetothermia bacterium]
MTINWAKCEDISAQQTPALPAGTKWDCTLAMPKSKKGSRIKIVFPRLVKEMQDAPMKLGAFAGAAVLVEPSVGAFKDKEDLENWVSKIGPHNSGVVSDCIKKGGADHANVGDDTVVIEDLATIDTGVAASKILRTRFRVKLCQPIQRLFLKSIQVSGSPTEDVAFGLWLPENTSAIDLDFIRLGPGEKRSFQHSMQLQCLSSDEELGIESKCKVKERVQKRQRRLMFALLTFRQTFLRLEGEGIQPSPKGTLNLDCRFPGDP